MNLLPAATKLGQGNIFGSVCWEFCSWGGVCPIACWDISPTRTRNRHPHWDQEQTPPGQRQTPSPSPWISSRWLLLRSVCSSGYSGLVGGGWETWNLCRQIRWPSFLWLIFTGPRGHGPLGPPPIPYWYASYCNAFLYYIAGRCSFETTLLSSL